MKINGLGNILKIFLQICLILGIGILCFLWKIAPILGLDFPFLVMMIYPCGVCFLIIIYQFIGLFDSLKRNDPFSKWNVIRLKRGKTASFIIFLLLCISLFLSVLLYNYSNLIVIYALTFLSVLFLGVGIALYILSELFKIAIEYKEENELTI